MFTLLIYCFCRFLHTFLSTIFTNQSHVSGIVAGNSTNRCGFPARVKSFACLVLTEQRKEKWEHLPYRAWASRHKDAAEARIESLRKEATELVCTCRSALEFNDKNAGAYAMSYSGLECVYCGRRGNRTEGNDSSMSPAGVIEELPVLNVTCLHRVPETATRWCTESYLSDRHQKTTQDTPWIEGIWTIYEYSAKSQNMASFEKTNG